MPHLSTTFDQINITEASFHNIPPEEFGSSPTDSQIPDFMNPERMVQGNFNQNSPGDSRPQAQHQENIELYVNPKSHKRKKHRAQHKKKPSISYNKTVNEGLPSHLDDMEDTDVNKSMVNG